MGLAAHFCVLTYSNQPDPDYLFAVSDNKRFTAHFLRYFRIGEKFAHLFLRA
jgi:hypothetical protein